MGYRHSKDEMLDAAVAAALTDGLPTLTFRTVAARLGIPDRTVVYYFPTKDRLLAAVLEHVTGRLQQLLDGALGVEPMSGTDLLAAAWRTLSSDDAAPATRVLLELVGLAARGREPYSDAATRLAASWISWVGSRLDGAPESRPGRAAALVAQLDGLLVLRAAAGAETADRAVRALVEGASRHRHPNR